MFVGETLGPLHVRLDRDQGSRLAVRIGIHTGPTVAGAASAGRRQAQGALGRRPTEPLPCRGSPHQP
jgi:hypothetical protein